MKYKLPCSCGSHVSIDPNQAGQTTRCVCGRQLEVPTLRHIRQLEPADVDTAPSRRRESSWSILQRVLFSLGLIVAVGGMTTTAYYQWGRMRLDVEEVPWDMNLNPVLHHFDTMTIDQAWNHWLKVRDSDIGPYRPPNFVVHRKIAAGWLTIVQAGLATTTGGVLMMVMAILLPRKSPKARKRRRPIP